MKSKNLLKLLLCILGLIAFVSIGNVFSKSLSPSAKAESNRYRINISTLKNGTFQLTEDGPTTYIAIKTHASEFYLYAIQTNKEGFILPDIEWFRVGGYCADFRPELNGEFKKENGVITCHDSKELSESYRWSYDGKNVGLYTHNKDMRAVAHFITGNYVTVGNP